MPDVTAPDKRFGNIAVSMAMVAQEKLDRALVVQNCIFTRTQVHMPIGKVLLEMGALTQDQVDEVLALQKQMVDEQATEERSSDPTTKPEMPKKDLDGIHLTLTSDKVSAYLSPTDVVTDGVTLEAVKAYLAERGVVYGLIEDKALDAYLSNTPLDDEPFKVAGGVAPIPGRPSEVIYHFETDPYRIGTLTSDGTMDWKNRGEIPQVAAGDLLVEKTEGDPGKPGMSVFGKELLPPRIKEPQLKCAKGVERSEDGCRVTATIKGTPKVNRDGKISVFSLLPIDGDIGVETGHIDFDGHIEASGGVNAGYSVKGKGLRTTEIQDATIDISEDLICDRGIYGSTLNVGGSIKSSHINSCQIVSIGDVVVEKEIVGCTIETNGRCVIGDGKILDSKIDAKKGVIAGDIGSEAAKPSELTVGFDRKYERDVAALKALLADMQDQKNDLDAELTEMTRQTEAIGAQLGELAQEQESFMAQKRQFEDQMNGEGPNAVTDDDEREMLKEMIVELDEKNAAFEDKAKKLMEQEDKVRLNMTVRKKSCQALNEKIAAHDETIKNLDETLKVDPGVSVVKASGTLYAKTHIIGAHKEVTIPQNMHSVRVAEVAVEGSAKYQMKISNMR